MTERDQPRILHDYWRSSASYRVRLALAWKGLDYGRLPVDLRHNEQGDPAFRALNPQGLVPFFAEGEARLSQSLAIIEYLDELHPQPPLLPADPLGRALVRSAAQIIACDIHPINNLRVLRYLKSPLGHSQPEIDSWARHWIEAGLAALEVFAEAHSGHYVYNDTLTIADLCLLPQLYNARRLELAVSAFPRLLFAEKTVLTQRILASAHPVDDTIVITGRAS